MLARDIGATVGELLDRMSYTEWLLWVEYYQWEAQIKGHAPRLIIPKDANAAAAALDRYAIPALRAKCRAT
jgi:hypothetical protein